MVGPRRFGRYELLERLGEGGMAEVYLARLAGPMGVARFVAVKRMLAAYGGDSDVERMFLDEARLMVRLVHPSIVAVYDFGKDQDAYFLSMEWIQGRDLQQIIRRAIATQRAIPLEWSLYVLAQIARALGYAHALADGKGRPLQIVHRDVSPSNILISYRGDAKLSDFGIARVADPLRQQHTEPGTIKGKVRYMSPEQARGDAIDSRADLFPLGTILFELLTLRPAFPGKSDLNALQLVQQGVPNGFEDVKHTLNDDVLALLERLLSPDPNLRAGSGEEVALALETLLRARAPVYGPAEVAAFVCELFPKEVGALKSKLGRYEFEEQPGGWSTGAAFDGPGSQPTSLEAPTRMHAPPRSSRRRVTSQSLFMACALGLVALIALTSPASSGDGLFFVAMKRKLAYAKNNTDPSNSQPRGEPWKRRTASGDLRRLRRCLRSSAHPRASHRGTRTRSAAPKPP
jgi:serine/threonine-protein kinase